MRIRSFCIIVTVILYAAAGYTSDMVITNDDLERKYPPEAPAGNKAWLWQQELRSMRTNASSSSSSCLGPARQCTTRPIRGPRMTE